MLFTEQTTIYYFASYDAAKRVADANQADEDDGSTYAVCFHAGRQAYYVTVTSADGFVMAL